MTASSSDDSRPPNLKDSSLEAMQCPGDSQVPGQTGSFLQHMQMGIQAAADDPSALLVFSGGQTRLEVRSYLREPNEILSGPHSRMQLHRSSCSCSGGSRHPACSPPQMSAMPNALSCCTRLAHAPRARATGQSAMPTRGLGTPRSAAEPSQRFAGCTPAASCSVSVVCVQYV